MVKITLYHKLFELALDVFFNALSNNFVHTKKIAVGNIYKNIRITRKSVDNVEYYETYNDCVIVNVYNGKYANNDVTLFNFECDNGNVIMGCSLFDSIIT